MSYTLLTPDDRQAMLQAVGAKSIEELLTQIPADIRLKRALNLPPALCEQELTVHISDLANKNRSADNTVCFLGGGAYDHFIPSVVDAIASRGENYTAYTPYQAEASQGTLQVGFEFQTLPAEVDGQVDQAGAQERQADGGQPFDHSAKR